ncbi:nitroreductase family protein [Paenibacillus crassostreae]|uniref:NAD(P)H nitroreductase n=1 Tax=Paenibacillus crassostreae TaxID=1763538 RepID=A0A167B8C1_9BACL|nr:nitroreductase family protein [Paenibacillus crassostreae]AOZ93081.1 nitroreductase family protein [Paenibacillus crassostreae]OAB71830.1 NAD(P)H nitroreductase [Paenibacillus crassostreae]
MSDFTSIVKDRRSANKFIAGVEIPDKELEEIFSLVKYAPSAFNLQQAHYVVVKDPEIMESIYLAANKQFKIKTASAVILVLGKKDAYKDAGRINEGLLNLGIMSKQEYDATSEEVASFYEGKGETFIQEDAIRGASISAMLFMLAAKERGWDTCPMTAYDPKEIRSLLNIPDTYVSALMITIGKEDTSSQRPRGYRKPVGEFVSYNKFS